MTDAYITYLEKKLKVRSRTVNIEDKYRHNFEKYAQYMGNGVYSWKGISSSDTRELFLLGVLRSEQIRFRER